MSWARTLLAVAWWEFRRVWKIKDVIISVALSIALAFAWYGVQKLLSRDDEPDPIRIVVLQTPPLELDLELPPDIELAPDDGRDAEMLRQMVEHGSYDGLIVIDDAMRGSIHVQSREVWLEQVRAALNESSRGARLADAGLAPETFAALAAPFELQVTEAAAPPTKSSTSEKIAAGIFVGLMIFALFIGNSYLFMFITGEKQQRVTEQVVSIISPQTWIDGKIAGLSVVALTSMVSMVIGMIVWNGTLTLLGQGYDLTFGIVRPLLVIQLAIVASLGFLLWFAFFGAIAATIDDPNNSSRSLFMFLPMPVLAVAIGCFTNPDDGLMRFLGVFPLTSPSVMPARLVLTDVAWWEFALSIALSIGAIWAMRRIAGKIFTLGILMHGTEPRWRDMIRAIWSA